MFVVSLLASAWGSEISVCTSGCDANTIQDGVDLAIGGDTLCLFGQHFEDAINIDKDLTIRGEGPFVSVTSTGGTVFQVPDGRTVTFENLTIDVNGAVGASGIDAHSATVTLSDVTIENAGNSAIIGAFPTLMLDQSLLHDNFGANGAGIAVLGGSVTTVLTDFRHNAAQQVGGAIWMGSGVLLSLESDYRTNSANASGGAMYLVDVASTFDGGSFTSNSVGFGSGGALRLGNDSAQVFDVGFVGNDAPEGGAIDIVGGQLSVTQGSFTVNTSQDGGGAMRVAAGTVATIHSSTFQNNSSLSLSAPGGGIEANAADEVIVTENFFSTNLSNFRGGGLNVTDTDAVLVYGNSFVDNQGGGGGGGARVSGSGDTAAIRYNRFCGNVANRGGALALSFLSDRTELTEVSNNVFYDNEGYQSGGAIEVIDSVTVPISTNVGSIYNNSFAANRAPVGASVHLEDARLFFVNNIVSNSLNGTAVHSTVAQFVHHNLFFANAGGHLGGMAMLGGGNIEDEDPLYQSFAYGRGCNSVNLAPSWGSPAVDAGEPSVLDPDGSVSDIGVHGGPWGDPDLWLDQDLDMVPAVFDCDDNDEFTSPLAAELCDGVDNDCNGIVDDDPAGPGATEWYLDEDEDGFGQRANSPLRLCPSAPPPSGYVDVGGDCDDDDDTVHPDADETCNGVDDDCNELIDDDPVDGDDWYLDLDEDGFGDDFTVVSGCQPTVYSWVTEHGDCDDDDDDVFPDADELCNEIDDDCDSVIDEDDAVDATTWWFDTDEDGFGNDTASYAACEAPEGYVALNTDCDDNDDTVHPDVQIDDCDRRDSNCDGTVDSDATFVDWYFDDDDDGYGQAVYSDCMQPDDHVAVGGDCNDSDDTIHPDATELCDGVDNDCVGGPSVDEVDADTDGYMICQEDCNDADDTAFPGATEVCDGDDENCDGAIDEGLLTEHFVDADGDGYGDATTGQLSCTVPSDEVTDATDCDDDDATVNPGRREVCNARDDDCNDLADDGLRTTTRYTDLDGDGFGTGDPIEVCATYPDTAKVDGDCADGDPDVNPDQPEVWYDGTDQDCDGNDDDQDLDGHAVPDDCDDEDPTIFPGAVDVADDGVDQDCTGVDVTSWYGSELECRCSTGAPGGVPYVALLLALVGVRRRGRAGGWVPRPRGSDRSDRRCAPPTA